MKTITTNKKDILIRSIIIVGMVAAIVGGYYAYLVRSGLINQ